MPAFPGLEQLFAKLRIAGKTWAAWAIFLVAISDIKKAPPKTDYHPNGFKGGRPAIPNRPG
jgi:hypothetical protein